MRLQERLARAKHPASKRIDPAALDLGRRQAACNLAKLVLGEELSEMAWTSILSDNDALAPDYTTTIDGIEIVFRLRGGSRELAAIVDDVDSGPLGNLTDLANFLDFMKENDERPLTPLEAYLAGGE